MTLENVGVLSPTKIPGLADPADIQEALRVYHYGGTGYEAETSATALPAPSMARYLYEIGEDITALENRPSSGGDAANSAPVAGDFIPANIPNGYIWVDQDGSLGGAPTGATSVFTNSAPTADLTTGLIWIDKDATAVLDNPFIPQAIIAAKGDILAGTANDVVAVLPVGSNGYVLGSASGETTGLIWIDSASSTQTLTNKTLTSPTISDVINFEGSTANAFETTLAVTDPTADRTQTLPDADGTVLLTSSVAPASTLAVGASGVGYVGIPQNATTTGAATLTAADNGKHTRASATRTVTIDSNANLALPIGYAHTFTCDSGATMTIAITTDTMYLAGPGTTGSRTLAPFGMATAIKITATTWMISGNGLA
jgi:hypothetical protein